MTGEIKSCSVDDARKAVYLNPNYQLVDVREKSEYDVVRIPNSILVPLSTLEKNTNKINKTEPAYLLCGVGKRATVAAEYLTKQGFTKLFVIDGGIKAWINAGYAFVGDSEKYKSCN